MPRYHRFEVTGLFDTGMYEYDNSYVAMNRRVAQRFADLDKAVTGLEVRLADPWQARAFGLRLETELGYPYRALDWQSQNAPLLSALKLEKLAMAGGGVPLLFRGGLKGGGSAPVARGRQ